MLTCTDQFKTVHRNRMVWKSCFQRMSMILYSILLLNSEYPLDGALPSPWTGAWIATVLKPLSKSSLICWGLRLERWVGCGVPRRTTWVKVPSHGWDPRMETKSGSSRMSVSHLQSFWICYPTVAGFAGVIKILRRGESPELLAWAQCSHRGS